MGQFSLTRNLYSRYTFAWLPHAQPELSKKLWLVDGVREMEEYQGGVTPDMITGTYT